EADGLGGFASGTAGLVRTRRYHALLLAAATPPTGRAALVAGFDAFVVRGPLREAISAQSYDPQQQSPDGAARIERFESEPWPTWTFRLADGARVTQEIFATNGDARVVVTWRLADASGRAIPGELVVRPFLAGRDYHALCSAADAARLFAEPKRDGERSTFAMPGALPPVEMRANAAYRHAPYLYEGFHYAQECERGFPHREDLPSPGELVFDFSRGEACWVLSAGEARDPAPASDARELAAALRDAERARRTGFASPLARAADAYIVRRAAGETIVAGYPWFTDWGRDTFISLRGLCLATGRLETAKRILLEWSGALADGVLPNRFADAGEQPEYNAVDASLWFVVCAHELLAELARRGDALAARDRDRLLGAVDAILVGYARGARHRIHLDRDGLIAAGEPGVQLTWMDARVGGEVITPRIGKPVEIQALWWNALVAAGEHDAKWRALAERARESFVARFWNPERRFLYDVVDEDHVAGRVDARLRPNQLFAIGGLPRALLEGERARAVVDVCERELWTPLGIRSLAPSEPGYAPRYEGGPAQRDRTYHQGTVWPWLLGAFALAWLRVRGDSPGARREARERFLAPLNAHLAEAGIGHVSEIADAEAPHAPRGCPFQAWSLAELLRLERTLGAVRA
ncbi:MAG TPA: amylo-alpha-1,6-glucosidase, partial [Myxococcota bacterium]|nr:amylo-alpha-1,6-glucosidase [Myxococcota bacterium]